jgi:hypothetical protein
MKCHYRLYNKLFTLFRGWQWMLPPRVFRKLVLVALLFILIVGSTGEVPTAKAAPPVWTAKVSLNVVAPRTTLCTSETVTYKADVYAEMLPATGTQVIKVAGVKVDAWPADPNIGTFLGPKKAGAVTRQSGADLLNPTSIVFKFKAGNKPGKSKLFFEGLVNSIHVPLGYVSFTVPIRVIACKYSVSTATEFSHNPAYNPMLEDPPFKAKMYKAELTADTIGHLNGSGIMHWVGSSYTTRSGPGPATAISKFSSTSPVSLNGEIYEDGKLGLDLTYEVVTGTVTAIIDGQTQSMPGDLYLLDPLKIIVPATGGTVTIPQAYNQRSFMGKTTVTVTLVQSK